MYIDETAHSQVGALRWFYAVPMGAAITFGLLVLMFKLVFTEEVYIDEVPPLPIPNVGWEKPDPIEDEFTKPDKPEKIDPPPEVPGNPVVDNGPIKNAIPTSKYEKPTFNGGNAFNPSLPIAQFMVTPRYPGRALARGIEGFVELRFDVNSLGATENVVVLRSEPKGIFDSSAIAAAKRWKFQPKTVEGKPVYFEGLSKVVTFEMQDS